MNNFKHIDNKDMYPSESQHIDYAEVYRAVKSTDTLVVDDFLPSNVEYANKGRIFRGLITQDYYGVSLFTDLESLKNNLKRFPALADTIKAYAKGFTSKNRGVSTRKDKRNHVNYYLYDYVNNSPKDDFSIVEVKEK